MSGHGWSITAESAEFTAPMEAALREVARYRGVADIEHTDEDAPRCGSVVVLGVAGGLVRLVPWDDKRGSDTTATPFTVPIDAITDLHIY